jgi:hypothetical protein
MQHVFHVGQLWLQGLACLFYLALFQVSFFIPCWLFSISIHHDYRTNTYDD